MAEKEEWYEKVQVPEKFESIIPDKEDYIDEYRQFFEKFSNVDTDDQVIVKATFSTVTEDELPGRILSHTIQFLESKGCPPGLMTLLCKEILEGTRKACAEDPKAFGYTSGELSYDSMELTRAMKACMCATLLLRRDDSRTPAQPLPTPCPASPPVCSASSRNGRCRMEDRHVILNNLGTLFGLDEPVQANFYAVYDGHSGHLAAAYAATHLHYHFVNHPQYHSIPQKALRDAFIKTDEDFCNKNLSGGTTAAVCYLRGSTLIVGWAGDTQALVVGEGFITQLVKPHKPTRKDELKRITDLGGCVIHKGLMRVNGILSVSRALGDKCLKPYVCCEPEIVSVKLTGFEEFVVLACDGLWDFVSEDSVALQVYECISEHPDDLQKVADRVVQLAQNHRSSDNISVVVIFLKDPIKLAEKATWLLSKYRAMNDRTNQDDAFSKAGVVFDLSEDYKQNGAGHQPEEPFFDPRPANGKAVAHSPWGDGEPEAEEEDEEDEDFGPETDVDAADDVLLSPSIVAARLLEDVDTEDAPEKPREEVNLALAARREETASPPVDAVLDISSGTVDNVGESGGEESEDEWNYFKGENKTGPAHPQPSHKPQDILNFEGDLDDTMNSPLNPEAPPFVPVSPTPGMQDASLSSVPVRLMDEVLSQSPQKPVPMDDINVPEPSEFESEVSTRLADLGSDEKEYLNGHSDNSALSSQENLKETLHGNEKQNRSCDFSGDDGDSQVASNDVNEAEFDRVQKDTTELCDIQVAYAPHSNESYEDEGIDEELYERLKNKERDPMSMSFYQEKDEDTCEIAHNPFDLNAVQTIPNDSDEDFVSEQQQPDNSVLRPLSQCNPFASKQDYDVTSTEINAAISDLDNAVTNEPDVVDIDFEKSGTSPVVFEKQVTETSEQMANFQFPIADVVSESEPRELDFVDQSEFAKPDSRDSVLSPEISLVASPTMDQDIELECEISHSSAPIAQSPIAVALSPEPLEVDLLEPECQSPISQILSSAAMSPIPPVSESPLPENQNLVFQAISPTSVDVAQSPLSVEDCLVTAEFPIPPSMSPTYKESEFFTQSPVLPASPFQLREDFSENVEQLDEIQQIEQDAALDDFVDRVHQDDAPSDNQKETIGDFYNQQNNFNISQPNSAIGEIHSLPKSPLGDTDLDLNTFEKSFSPCNIPQIDYKVVIDQAPQQIPIDLVADETFPNYQGPVREVCEFVESAVAESVKNVDDFLMEEVCKPLTDNLSDLKMIPPNDKIVNDYHSENQETENIQSDDSKIIDFRENLQHKHDIPVTTSQSSSNGIFELELENQKSLIEIMEPEFQPKIDSLHTMESCPVPSFPALEKMEILSPETETSPTTFELQNMMDVDPVQLLANMKNIEPENLPVAATTAVLPVSLTIEAKKTPLKTKTTTSIKKTSTSKAATSPAKPPVSKSVPITTAAKKPTTLTSKTMASPKSTPATKPKTTAVSPTKAAPPVATIPPKLRPSLSAATKAAPEKKSLSNGEVKKEPIRRPIAGSVTTTKASAAPKPAASRATPAATRPVPARPAASRPATAPTRPAQAKPAVAAVPKPKLTSATATKTLVNKPSTGAIKAPPADKLTKDTTNKQISAARPSPVPRASLASKTLDTKTTKTTTKTTTTTTPPKPTNPPPIRRPTSATTKTTLTKTMTTTKGGIKQVKTTTVTEKQNGMKDDLIEGHLNGTPLICDLPMKDSSPQQVDNSLLPIIDAAAD